MYESYFRSASINRDKINDQPGHRDMLLKPGRMESLHIMALKRFES